jgi:hypothetical protein
VRRLEAMLPNRGVEPYESRGVRLCTEAEEEAELLRNPVRICNADGERLFKAALERTLL